MRHWIVLALQAFPMTLNRCMAKTRRLSKHLSLSVGLVEEDWDYSYWHHSCQSLSTFSKRWETIKKFNEAVLEISNVLLQRSKEEKKETGDIVHDTNRSIIDTLSTSTGLCFTHIPDIIVVEAEYASGRARLSESEIRDQVYLTAELSALEIIEYNIR